MEINEVEFHFNQNAFEDNTFGLRGLKTLRRRMGDGFLRARDKVEKENSKKLSERELRNKNSSIMLSLLVLLQSSVDFEILLLINSSTAIK